MGMSNFPSGFKDGVTINGVPITMTNTGEVFFVSNADVLLDKNQSVAGVDQAGGGTFQRPFRTVDFAIGQCTANRGDIIYVMPGHTETVTSTSIALDVAGVNIICLGHAENQATFTYSADDSTITVSGDNCVWVGGLHQSTILDCASAFTVNAGDHFLLSGGKFEDTSDILNFLSIVTTTTNDNAEDGLQVTGNTFYGLNTTPLAFVSILGDIKDLLVDNNFVDSAATADVGHFITFAAKDSVGTRISNNQLVVVGATDAAVGIFLTGSGTGHTGTVKGNLVSSLDTTAELIATAGTGLVFFENYYTGVADASGKLWPVVDAA